MGWIQDRASLTPTDVTACMCMWIVRSVRAPLSTAGRGARAVHCGAIALGSAPLVHPRASSRRAVPVGCDPRSCTCQHRVAVAAAGLRVTGGEVYGVRAHAFWIGLNFEIPFANQPAQLHMTLWSLLCGLRVTPPTTPAVSSTLDWSGSGLTPQLTRTLT